MASNIIAGMDYAQKRARRAAIMYENMREVFPAVIKKLPKAIEESLDGTETYTLESTLLKDFDLSKFPDLDGKVDVVEQDCIDATLDLVSKGLKPAMLNMASDVKPGGGVLTGASAQEEEICLRLTLYMFLAGQSGMFKSPVRYRLPEVSVVYTPKVFEVRDLKYQILKPDSSLPKFDILSSAAIRKPELHKDGKFNNEDMNLTLEKIELLLQVALLKGNDSTCLSAWGCGAFGNHPKWVAKLFIKILTEKGYLKKFKYTRFAIIGGDNYTPFKKEFKAAGLIA